MKFPKIVCIALVVLFGAMLFAACNGLAARNKQDKALSASAAAKPAKPDTQRFEISRNSNFVAQAAADTEFEANIYLPGEARPRRTVVRAKEGTWIVPEGLYTISPFPGHGVVCDAKVCEVAK